MHILTKHNLAEFNTWRKAVAEEGAALLIDKAKDWTSFDVVAKIRNSLKIKKVGHAGTLDPLATGLLIVCVGKATKKINEYQEKFKVYSGIIKLGATTKTDDAEAEEENIKDVNCTIEQIRLAADKLTGKLNQIPPIFSARKVKGRRLYELARKNISVEIPPKEVEVYSFEIINFENPFIKFKIKCSKGTYIRSLARDLGEILSTGGYLNELRRDAIGQYNVDNAFTVNDLLNISKISETNSEINESI
jgi:tRNA pseudouridine55 synthase